jgi:endoglucanase
MKKFVCMVLSVSLLTSLFLSPAMVSAEPTYNYAEALQKSIYFYETLQAGPLPEWNRVEWRGDATMNDYIKGGLYDAGDHVKFNLPMAYTASMLGWALYEYGEGIEKAGQKQHMENNLKFILDYLVECDLGDKVVYQVGDGQSDHNWWGPVEVLEKEVEAGNMKRPYHTITKATCVTAQMSAALAIGAKLFKNDTYLKHAKSLFELSDKTRSDEDYNNGPANNFYKSWSGFYDELMWSAAWLNIATGDAAYLQKAGEYVKNLNKQNQTDKIEYKDAHSWDDVHYGAMVLLAKLTDKKEYHDFVQMHLDFWTTGYNGEKITYTPGGLAWVREWGPLRYSMNTSFVASVYADFVKDAALKTKYMNFVTSQINYALGSNPDKRSYVVGFGVNPPEHPHHRTSHGSWADSQKVPEKHRHILYGALVGGPGKNDDYKDDIGNYITNEVACDYNAGFVGVLSKMVSLHGGTALTNFPEAEARDDEFFVEAKLNSTGTEYTEIKALVNNRSAWPARTIKNLSFRYYFDASEVLAAGASMNDIKVSTNYVEFPVKSSVKQHKGNIYYVSIAFDDGTSIYPGGQSEFAGEIQFRIAAPSGTKYWDASNDFSAKGLTNGTEAAKTKYIPVYDGETRIFGYDPDNEKDPNPTPTKKPDNTPTPTKKPETSATPTTTSVQNTATPKATGTPTPTNPASTPTPTKPGDTATPTQTPGGSPDKGDIDGDGNYTSLDVVLVKRHILEINNLTGNGVKAADMNGDGKVDSTDYALLKRKVIGK